MSLCLACTMPAHAQQDVKQQYLDTSEDTTQVTTINDIIKMQQEVTLRNSNIKHFEDVWNRRSYFNISYNSTTLSPKENIPTGVPGLNGGKVPDFKSDWGFGVQLGRNYRLHKKPIANTVQLNIDYTYIDFNVNHFKAEGNGKGLYDSNNQFTEDGNTTKYYYTPWNLQKYEASFGMSVGPSVTIAPFNYIDTPALHFLKFNVYYHLGYGISAVFMPNDAKADINTDTSSSTYKKMEENLKLNWGHGMTSTFGLSLSWKAIGLGYEHLSTTLKYKAASTEDFGKDSHEFTRSSNRIYIQLRI